MAPKQTQIVERRPDFRVFSAPLEIKDVEGDGRPTLFCTASSTAIDLEADRFTKSALMQMKDGLKGKVIFLNHSYRVPLDVFGLVTETSLVKRGGRLDLDMAIRVQMENPLAVQTYEYVVNGTRLGVSVGVIVTEAEKTEEEDAFGSRIVDISGIIPLEASIVGIPANQTAWTREAVKSLFERGAIEFDEEEIAARPWLGTVVEIDKKEDSMSKDDTKVDEKHTDDSEEEDSAETDDSDDNADADEETDDSDADDADEDVDETDDTDGSDDADGDSDDSDSDDGDSDEDSDEDEEDDEHKEDAVDPDKKDNFDDDVAADEAVSMLVNKMYTGLYAALDNLVPVIRDTDGAVNDRAKAGQKVIADWNEFVEKLWDEIMEHLDESKDVDTDKDFDLAVRLHDLAAEAETVECEVAELAEVTAQVEEIGEVAEAIAEENTQLRKDAEEMAEELEYAVSVYEAIMDLPLPTVTKAAAEVARSLADRNPDMDTGVMARIKQHAPPRRN